MLCCIRLRANGLAMELPLLSSEEMRSTGLCDGVVSPTMQGVDESASRTSSWLVANSGKTATRVPHLPIDTGKGIGARPSARIPWTEAKRLATLRVAERFKDVTLSIEENVNFPGGDDASDTQTSNSEARASARPTTPLDRCMVLSTFNLRSDPMRSIYIGYQYSSPNQYLNAQQTSSIPLKNGVDQRMSTATKRVVEFHTLFWIENQRSINAFGDVPVDVQEAFSSRRQSASAELSARRKLVPRKSTSSPGHRLSASATMGTIVEERAGASAASQRHTIATASLPLRASTSPLFDTKSSVSFSTSVDAVDLNFHHSPKSTPDRDAPPRKTLENATRAHRAHDKLSI